MLFVSGLILALLTPGIPSGSVPLWQGLICSIVVGLAIANDSKNSRSPQQFHSAGLVRENVLQEIVNVTHCHAQLKVELIFY
jgi:hypothetical protein